MDDYLFIKPSSYCALTALQWFTAFASLSPEMKQSILDTRHRVTGVFQYLGATDAYYEVRLPNHTTPLQVVKASVEIPGNIKPGNWLFMNLVSYRGEFWMSGMMASYGEQDEREMPDTQLPFFMQDAEMQQAARENTKQMEADFRTEFGDLVYISRDFDDLKARMYAFWSGNRARIAAENPDQPLPPLDEAMLTAMVQGIPEEPGTAVVYVPGEGMLFEPNAIRTLELLRQEGPLEPEARRDLFFGLVAETHPVTLDYLLAQAPDQPVIFPAQQSEANVRPFLRFFSRYIQPDQYLPPVPHVRVAGSA
jgi:hypothetical protein